MSRRKSLCLVRDFARKRWFAPERTALIRMKIRVHSCEFVVGFGFAAFNHEWTRMNTNLTPVGQPHHVEHCENYDSVHNDNKLSLARPKGPTYFSHTL